MQLTLPQRTGRAAAFDHRQLYAAGLAHVQRLARRVWTDYNVHDPGITVLELLCYALTDLSYRAALPVADLLATPADNAANMRGQFFTARQLLPNRPLTLLDYRKLLIDLPGVKNAWLQPAPVTFYADMVKGELLRKHPQLPGIVEVNVKGRHDVLIDFMEDLTSDAARKKTLRSVAERLQANRNLGEDFREPTAVPTADFLLCAELELAADANVSQVKAEVLFRVQQYLAPPVPNYTLSEMLARRKPDDTPYTAAEIFDGPALDCGFMDDAELRAAELRTEIRLSDLISIIMDIPGVQAVRDMVVNPQGTPGALENKWLVAVEAGRKARLDRDASRLVFYKRNLPVEARAAAVQQHYQALANAARTKAETVLPGSEKDFPIPLGRFRNAAAYYSFQNHFPTVYGLSEAGLTSGSDDARQARAYQLKAYLLCFDQVMANYFAQLGRVRELLATDPALHQTYFQQVVASFAAYDKIYADGLADLPAALEKIGEPPATQLERRSRFLDHLIARFAEQFHEYVNIMFSAFGATPASLIAHRCAFLRDYPEISRERALAYNYTLKADADLWNSANVSGLEKRLARLLGLGNFTRRNLGDIAYDIYAEIDQTPGDEFRFRIRKRDTGEIILSSSTRYATRALARQEMRTAIHFASIPDGFQRKTNRQGRHYFNVINAAGEVIARRLEYFDTEATLAEAITELMEYLRVHYSDDGWYLLENLLLLPQQNTDPFLPICPDPNCTDCAEADPYSYRIHIILPAYSARFSNLDFRRYAEAVIRTETPAHILPKICWISRDDMAVLEKAYRDWVSLKAGVETTQRKEKLNALIQILFAAKNVYPTQQLHECGGAEAVPKFIVGQTSLGTLDGDAT